MTQKGRGIFLGQPVGTPTGICIGKPGLMFFKSGAIFQLQSLQLNLTTMTVDLTNQQVQFHG